MKFRLIAVPAVLALACTVPLIAGTEEEGEPAPGNAHACGPHGEGAGLERVHAMLKELGVTEEQGKKLHELIYRVHREAVDLEATQKKAMMDIHHQMMANTLDEAKLHASIDAVTTAHAALAKHLVSGAVAASEILGKEAWAMVRPHLMRMHLGHEFGCDLWPGVHDQKPERHSGEHGRGGEGHGRKAHGEFHGKGEGK